MKNKSLAILVLVWIAVIWRAEAQSLIAGIPNIAVAEKGKLELTHESQFGPSEGKGYPLWNSFTFACYGLNKHTELTASVSNLNNAGARNEVVGIGFKSVKPLATTGRFASLEPKIAVGLNGYARVYQSSVGYWAYGLSSIRLPLTRTRLTAGGGYGTGELFGFKKVYLPNANEVYKPLNNAHAMLGLEQPVYKHFSFIADWYSGNHDLAALITAVQLEQKHNVIIAGYKFPNDSKKSGAIIIEVMHRF